ncbi:hypothetical protein HNO88_001490 [Novosphingobium chloroacetimidivorans]|uniref:Uncharacterized protein n=1 Tax=Novosphingobium chloroacetimidivorans TaxID=1428314 RepID=A0A7W7NVE6_9SPHN|nr:hypothetical protein [Novosphingobium chloroacetimidivorans]MBB4858171.1 hypothetical protein [Novosphingobium chloroacetimidivorans]
MTYRIDYTGDDSDNSNVVAASHYTAPEIRYIEMPRRGFGIPSIVKTSAALLLGGAVLFGLEAQGPVELRPSTLMGTYDSRIEEQVKAAEMRVQGRYEGWAAQVKASAEQNVEQYKAKTNGLIAAYQGGLDRAKTYAQLTGQLQSQLVGAQLSRTGNEQSLEVALISWGRLLGTGLNIYHPGSGDQVMGWAEVNSDRLEGELNDAVLKGQRVSIEGWDTGLPSAAELQRQLDDVEPLKVPPMPALGPEHGSDR